MSDRTDRLTLLATFARIAERGSISAAARDLGVSQAAASRHLADLEKRLGASLIQRTTHALTLTEDGAAALRDARALLDGWDAFVEARSENARGALRGPITVVAPVALGQGALAAAASAFQRAHPDVRIAWRVDDAPVRFAEIGADLWIKVGRVPDDTLVQRGVGSVERLVVAAPDRLRATPVAAPADLDGAPFAALDPFEGVSFTLADAEGWAVAVAAEAALSSNNIFATLAAARAGVGFAVMPRWLVAPDLESGALVDALPGWRAPPLKIRLAYRAGARRPRRLTALIDHLAAAVPRIPGVGPPD